MKRLFIFLFVGYFLNAEITDQEILYTFNNGCIEEDNPEFTVISPGFGYEYCGCATNLISQRFDYEEFLSLAIGSTNLNDNEMTAYLLSSEKLTDIMTTCVSKAIGN